MSKETGIGAVKTPAPLFVITLARVILKTLGRTAWIAMTAVAAVVLVVLSWSVPEPESQDVPVERFENSSYTQCAAPEVAPPSYGARWLRSCNR